MNANTKPRFAKTAKKRVKACLPGMRFPNFSDILLV